MATKTDRKGDLPVAWKIVAGTPWPFEPEFRFHEKRRWRFDWFCEASMLAVEIEGLTYFGGGIGRHQSASGAEGDMDKYNTALEHGIVVLRYSQRMIARDPVGVVNQIRDVLEMRQ